jgi:hypothetical protein
MEHTPSALLIVHNVGTFILLKNGVNMQNLNTFDDEVSQKQNK